MSFQKQCQNCEHGNRCPSSVIATIRCALNNSDHLPNDKQDCWKMPKDRKKLFEGVEGC